MSVRDRDDYAVMLAALKNAGPTKSPAEQAVLDAAGELFHRVLCDLNRLADAVEQIANELSVRPPR